MLKKLKEISAEYVKSKNKSNKTGILLKKFFGKSFTQFMFYRFYCSFAENNSKNHMCHSIAFKFKKRMIRSIFLINWEFKIRYEIRIKNIKFPILDFKKFRARFDALMKPEFD
ncbi:hypothetical protein BpHYR1_009774 [Brachionus plicatilis]|uniref:Uncharacterized protein n=1 Tax=Brachionus plicatilis TaxID=10195 RepID=A0A3M7T9R9_BRAPC|nr:hypothetical protein BpHYR1_009774 [Brachionus plicatilis]